MRLISCLSAITIGPVYCKAVLFQVETKLSRHSRNVEEEVDLSSGYQMSDIIGDEDDTEPGPISIKYEILDPTQVFDCINIDADLDPNNKCQELKDACLDGSQQACCDWKELVYQDDLSEFHAEDMGRKVDKRGRKDKIKHPCDILHKSRRQSCRQLYKEVIDLKKACVKGDTFACEEHNNKKALLPVRENKKGDNPKKTNKGKEKDGQKSNKPHPCDVYDNEKYYECRNDFAKLKGLTAECSSTKNQKICQAMEALRARLPGKKNKKGGENKKKVKPHPVCDTLEEKHQEKCRADYAKFKELKMQCKKLSGEEKVSACEKMRAQQDILPKNNDNDPHRGSGTSKEHPCDLVNKQARPQCFVDYERYQELRTRCKSLSGAAKDSACKEAKEALKQLPGRQTNNNDKNPVMPNQNGTPTKSEKPHPCDQAEPKHQAQCRTAYETLAILKEKCKNGEGSVKEKACEERAKLNNNIPGLPSQNNSNPPKAGDNQSKSDKTHICETLKKNEKTVCYEKYSHLKTLKPKCEAGDESICQQMKDIRKTLPQKPKKSGAAAQAADKNHICNQAYDNVKTQEECFELYKKWKEYKSLCNKPGNAQYCKMATNVKAQLPFGDLTRGIMDYEENDVDDMFYDVESMYGDSFYYSFYY